MALTNGLRQEAGEAPLETDETLMAAAQIRAEECAAMDDLDNYNHVRPDGGPFYTVLGDRLTGYASENLAMVSALSAREAVTVWENSSGHYQNMVNPEITRIGVGGSPLGQRTVLLLPDLYGRLTQTWRNVQGRVGHFQTGPKRG